MSHLYFPTVCRLASTLNDEAQEPSSTTGLRDDEEDDDSSSGCGDDAGLSELGSASSVSTTSSWFPEAVSRMDMKLSRVTIQFEDCKRSKAKLANSPGKASSKSGTSLRLGAFLRSEKGSKASGSPDVRPCSGNGKNLTRVVDLPAFVPWIPLGWYLI